MARIWPMVRLRLVGIGTLRGIKRGENMEKSRWLLAAAILLAAAVGGLWAADQRILYTEEMVGATHPTKSDTLNRLAIVDHGNDGQHTLTGYQGSAYAADAEASDTYVVTLDPVPAAYFAGMTIRVLFNTANTGAATINVNSLGAKTIKKMHDQDLEDNDIEATQISTLIYDGTNFQMQGQLASATGTGAPVRANTPTLITPNIGAATGDSAAITGAITGGVSTVTDADGFTMTALQGRGYVVYATGAGTIVMPPAVAGANFVVECHAAAAVVLNPDASGTEDTIRLDGTALAQGDSITSTSTLGDIAVCTYYAADTWSCLTNSWTDTN